MADSFQGVKGLREMGVAINRLEDAIRNKLAGRATNAGAQVIKAIAQKRAAVADEPYMSDGVLVKPGNIAKNVIVKRIPKGQTALTSEHIVTVRHKGPGVVGHPYRTAIFYEFGTVRDVNSPPFMRPAFDIGKRDAIEAIKNELADGIEEGARK